MATVSSDLLSASSNLLFCAEDASWDDDGDDAAAEVDEWAPSVASLVTSGGETTVVALLAGELDHMPSSDYLARFHSRTLDATSRRDAVHWILKVNEFFRFRPVTAYLSINYFDRFLSSHSLPGQNGKVGGASGGGGWPMHLLSVACVSVAAKMEETHVPLLVDLQILDPRFVFESRTVRRMELLLMAALRWRMHAVTPFDFLHHLLLTASALPASSSLFSRASDLILSTHRVVDFLGYRPSVIAAAAVLCAADEIADFSPADIVELWSSFMEWASKEAVSGCRQLMEEYLIDTCPFSRCKSSKPAWDQSQPTPAPQSPVGVLDAAASASCDSKSSATAVTALPEIVEAHHPTKRRRLIDEHYQQRTARLDGKSNSTVLDGNQNPK